MQAQSRREQGQADEIIAQAQEQEHQKADSINKDKLFAEVSQLLQEINAAKVYVPENSRKAAAILEEWQRSGLFGDGKTDMWWQNVRSASEHSPLKQQSPRQISAPESSSDDELYTVNTAKPHLERATAVIQTIESRKMRDAERDHSKKLLATLYAEALATPKVQLSLTSSMTDLIRHMEQSGVPKYKIDACFDAPLPREAALDVLRTETSDNAALRQEELINFLLKDDRFRQLVGLPMPARDEADTMEQAQLQRWIQQTPETEHGIHAEHFIHQMLAYIDELKSIERERTLARRRDWARSSLGKVQAVSAFSQNARSRVRNVSNVPANASSPIADVAGHTSASASGVRSVGERGGGTIPDAKPTYESRTVIRRQNRPQPAERTAGINRTMQSL